MIDIVLLGSGATMPSPERGLSAAALRCGGRCILFDCGEGTQVALSREKISPVKIDLIALTHYHGDHTFGLPGLLQTMNCLRRSETLYITGPNGLEEALKPILQMAGPLDFAVRLAPEITPSGFSMQFFHEKWPHGASLRPFPTEHRVPSQGYVFLLSRPAKFLPEKAKAFGIPKVLWKQIIAGDPAMPICVNGEVLTEEGQVIRGLHVMGEARKGLRIVFTGDTQPCRKTAYYGHHADLLIHDATYGEDDQAEEAALWGHSTFKQAAAIAAEAQARQLWLTHFSQAIKVPEAYLENAAAVFPAARCGHDGLRVTLGFDSK